MTPETRIERPIRVETARLVVRLAEPDDVDALIDYERRNTEHFARWSPARAPDAFDPDARRQRIARRRADADADRAYAFIAVLRDEPARIVASVNLDHIVRFAFQACILGYSVDEQHEGTGIASEAVRAVVRFAFDTLRLHRVMANYQPVNERSGRLLRRLGFVPEGYARDYLFIDGAWRDHVLTALVNPNA